MAAETPTAITAEVCDHGSTYTVEFDTLEFCLVCGELVRYFADDAQEWVEVQ